jgi:hypothetical protein
MRMTLDLDLPNPLFSELEQAARDCKIEPSLFAAEAIECVIAGRRLKNVKRGAHGARIAMPEIEEGELLP